MRHKVISCYLLILVFTVTCVQADQSFIRLLYVNDLHGFAEPYTPLGSDEMLGGVASLSAKVNALRNQRPSLLLAAGDMIQGNNWANLTLGESVIALMNLMRFDAMVVGNHEFDFGQEILKQRISEADFPVLGANVQGFEMLKPYMIKEVAGTRIAVLGVVTDETPVSTHPGNVAGLTFLPPERAVKKYIHELRNRVDIIVVLSHIGHRADRLLAENVEGIDVIVGGHSHTRVLAPVVIGNTIVLQAWEHGKALGVLDLLVEDGCIIKYHAHMEEIKPASGGEDSAVRDLVEKYQKRIDSALDEIIGEADVDLDGENVRKRETNFGNLIADIMRNTSGAEATITNAGGIRASIKKGEIRIKDVYTALPFNNSVVAVRLTGKKIQEALEHGVSCASGEEGAGRFPQVSGLAFTYSGSAVTGSKIRNITIAGKPLDPDKEYVVATNDFVAAGGDGYTVFVDAGKSSGDFSITGGMRKGEKLVFSDSGKWLRDVVAEYIKARKRVAPTVEDRILEIP